MPDTLDDKHILTDVLMTFKHFTEEYNKSILECANQNLKQDMVHIWEEEVNSAGRVFTTMNQRGWYPATESSTANVGQRQTPAT